MEIFAIGSNGSGQLGLGTNEDVSRPTRCHILDQCIQDHGLLTNVATGGNHTLILFSSGKIFSAGSYSDSQLTIKENLLFSSLPASILNGDSNVPAPKAKLCSATWSASVIVTTDDMILTWGTGNKGELGQGKQLVESESPCRPLDFSTELLGGSTIVDLASGVQHTVIVLSNGDVYGWGNGRKGQLGEPADVIWQPRKIAGLDFKVVRAVCGREFTYLVGHPQVGCHVVLGADKWMVKTNAPSSVLDWSDIGASWGSLFVLDQAGKVTSWGRNDHGQLAPINLPLIKQIAIGSEHALALTQQGKIIAWGWGEHGNCGSGIDQDGDVKPHWNELLLPASESQTPFVSIAAGCATSWMWAHT